MNVHCVHTTMCTAQHTHLMDKSKKPFSSHLGACLVHTRAHTPERHAFIYENVHSHVHCTPSPYTHTEQTAWYHHLYGFSNSNSNHPVLYGTGSAEKKRVCVCACGYTSKVIKTHGCHRCCLVCIAPSPHSTFSCSFPWARLALMRSIVCIAHIFITMQFPHASIAT